jgi:REP element-mobilizing transposase RayT
MPDHLHVILASADSGYPLSKFLNIFKGRTTAILRQREGSNKVWQRSGFDHVIRADEDLRAVIEYILDNPVRKGMVEKANDYPYSRCLEVEIRKYL